MTKTEMAQVIVQNVCGLKDLPTVDNPEVVRISKRFKHDRLEDLYRQCESSEYFKNFRKNNDKT